jgi:hypothetical protein
MAALPPGYSRCPDCQVLNSHKRQSCHKCGTQLPHWYSDEFSPVQPLSRRSKLELFREILASFPVWQHHRHIGLWAMLGLLVASWLMMVVPGVKGWLEHQTEQHQPN